MTTILEFFSELNDQVFYFYPNPGNAGDSLIALGTFDFFQKNKINYHLISSKTSCLANKNIIYGGGGNLGKMTTISERFLNHVHKNAKRVIILPHTIKEIDSLLEDFRSNTHIFCREHVTYDYVSSLNPLVNVYLDHDMAFHANLQNLNPKNFNFILRHNLIRYVLYKFNLSTIPAIQLSSLVKLLRYESIVDNILKERVNSEVLNAFRLDGEKTDIYIPENNQDLSELLSLGVNSEELCRYVVSNMIYILSQFKYIRTNRLHIAILCALINKKVEFYPNNYYKCEAVYQYSIKDKFPCVKWMSI